MIFVQNVEILKEYELMYEEYLKIESTLNHDHDHHQDVLVSLL